VALRRAPAGLAPAIGLVAVAAAFVPGLPPQLLPFSATPPILANDAALDERAFYHDDLALFSEKRKLPQYGKVSADLRAVGFDRPVVDVYGQVGVRGYQGGDLVHVVDVWLCDPLLMRLPALDHDQPHIGHLTRRIPEGYLETLAGGHNVIAHPGLAAYWDHLVLALRGPLWSGARLRAVLAVLLGEHDAGLRAFVAGPYREPPLVAVDAAELAAEVPLPGFWFDRPCRLIGEGGVEVRFNAPPDAAAITLVLDAADRYLVEFVAGDRTLAQTVVAIAWLPLAGFAPYEVPVPAAAAGFDRLRLYMAIGEQRCLVRMLPGISLDWVWAVAAVRPH